MEDFVTRSELNSVLSTLRTYLDDGAGRIGENKVGLIQLRTSIGKLERIVIEGNGQPSIIAKLARFETQLDLAIKTHASDHQDLEDALKSVLAEISEIRSDSSGKKLAQDDKNSKRTMLTAILVTALTVLGALLGALIQKLFH